MFTTPHFEVQLESALEIKSFFFLKMEPIANSKGPMKNLTILDSQREIDYGFL